MIGYLFERLLQAGALDVFTTAIGMKKNRPGILLNVLCYPEQGTTCEEIIFTETTTLGIRRSLQERRILERRIDTVETPYGSVRIKIAWQEGQSSPMPLNVQPEYEDCATIARNKKIPWFQVHQAAMTAWQNQRIN